MTSHSLFSASAAHRWVRCPGSIALTEHSDVHDTGSAAASEGTLLHEVLNWCLAQERTAADWADTHEFLSIEQDNAVQECIDYVRALPKGELFLEFETNYGSALGQSGRIAFGTLDVGLLEGSTLHVLDAKFGRKHVDTSENFQLLLYAIGMVSALQSIGEEIEAVVLHIMQPRTSSSNDPWTLDMGTLAKWAETFRKAAVEVQEARASFGTAGWEAKYLSPSVNACQWCPVKAVCPALRAVADDAANQARSADVSEFDEDTLSTALDMLPLLEQFVEAVKTEGLARLADGKPVSGYKLVTGRAGNRKWKGDDSEVVTFLTSEGVDDPYQPLKPLTPSQAETALAAVIRELDGGTVKDAKREAATRLGDLLTRNPPKPTLARETDPGKPWQAGASLEEFDD